jgi:uncharacterized protein (DUF1778 family)
MRKVDDIILKIRLDPNDKKLIEEAAALEGRSVSGFAKAALIERAKDGVERHQSSVLTQRDMRAFTKYLASNPSPTPALRAAARRWRALRSRLAPLMKEAEASKAEYRKKGGISHAEMKKRILRPRRRK